MPARTKFNWDLIEEVYIAGRANSASGESIDWSYGEIGAKFGIRSRATVKKHADRRGWPAKREAYKRKQAETIRETLRKIDIPSIVDMRKLVLKSQLGTVNVYNKRLDAGEVEPKPLDAIRASEFIIDQYNTLFGIREQPPEQETDVKVKVDVEVSQTHDILRRASRLISGADDEADEEPDDTEAAG